MALGYGVMVTLQILVLPFLVRVRVPQLKEKSRRLAGFLFLFLVLSVDRLDLLAEEIHVVLQFLYLTVHLVDKAVTFL